MQNPPATIYRLNNEHAVSELYETLADYHDKRHVTEVQEPLETTVEQLEKTERGLSFVLEHDYVHTLRQRGQDEPVHIKATKSVTGRFCKNIASDGFILMGSGHDIAAGPVTKAIEGRDESYVELQIAPTTITTIVSMDSQDARYKIWENIDVFTNMASIQGKVKDSTYSQDFDEYGRPVWVMFDSKYLGETVGISKSGFVVYGADIEPEDIESYFFDVMKKAIES
ncbi:hypothetical protein [Haloferax sp. ATB1]|uniref:hypothetical protein n=1 Tax=Haloferax sp. ATB1 TaxID=1508454 RepID=UPI000FE14306|nr:hypothetical protein [Haloferax sp. ATB1]